MPPGPNIVVVMADQLRRQAFSHAGDPNVQTPHIDALAADGVRCSNANTTYPICVPNRFAFVTGEYAHTRHAHHGWRMSPAERTFAHDLADAGYQTAWVGKWHLADVGRDRPVPPHLQGGFEHWRGFELKNAPFETSYYVDDDPTPHPIEGYQTDGLTDLAIDFFDERDEDRPFCLVLSVEPPHPPFTAPEKYLDRVADRELELRPNVPYDDPDALPGQYDAWGDLESATDGLYERHRYFGDVLLNEMRAYYAMVENLDDNVGRLRTALADRGLADETALFLTADHGEMMGSHGHMAKQRPYEESVGVPLIGHQPGAIEGGRVIEPPVCTEDWFPTISSIAGGEAPNAPGTDLTPLFTGERTELDRDGVLLEFAREVRSSMPFFEDTWRGFRTDQYKYTVLGGEPWQLFDLAADPYEQNNLVDSATDRAADLHGTLRDRLIETNDDYVLDPAFGHAGLNQPSSPFDER